MSALQGFQDEASEGDSDSPPTSPEEQGESLGSQDSDSNGSFIAVSRFLMHILARAAAGGISLAEL